MAGTMLELVRELKLLNKRKKAGEALSEAELQRRRELKIYLKAELEKEKAAAAAAAAAPSVAPQPAAPAPPPQAATPPPQPAAPAPQRPPQPAAAAPPARNQYADKFKIDAGDLLKEAAQSDAVNALNKTGAHASAAELAEAEEKAQAALKANNKRARVSSPEDAIAQLEEIEAASGYTPPEISLTLDGYYGEFVEEGYQFVEEEGPIALEPIDPREIELHRAGALSATEASADGSASVTVPPGLAFLDDFSVLYQKDILPNPADEIEADLDDPDLLIPGKRKVTVHFLNGQVKRGAIKLMRKGDLGFTLDPVGTGHAEDISLAQLKAIFVHRRKKADSVRGQGPNLTVTFTDGRKVMGNSDDYQPGLPTFTLVPPPGRGQFERIIVNAAAVKHVAGAGR